MMETANRKISNINALIARLICSLIVILFLGCHNSEEKGLSVKNNFWYSYEYDAPSDSFRITNYGYRFHDKDVDIMSYDFDKNEMSEIVIDDVLIPKEWYIDSSKEYFISRAMITIFYIIIRILFFFNFRQIENAFY